MGKRIVCLLCALMLAFSAVGCGGPQANQADTDAVNAALQKFSDCSSFTAVQLTYSDETFVLDGEQINCIVSNTMEMSIVTEPEFQMKTVTTAKLSYDGEQMDQSTASYIFSENGVYTEYANDGSQWYKFSTKDAQPLAELNAGTVASTFYVDSLSFCKVGEEALEGGKAAHYEGVLAGEELLAMLATNGYLNNISTMSENQQKLITDNLLKDLDGVTVSVWVDVQSGYPVRFEVSMTELLKQLNESIAKSLGNKEDETEWSVNECVISMTVKDFDSVEQIVLPPEAANAEDYEGA